MQSGFLPKENLIRSNSFFYYIFFYSSSIAHYYQNKYCLYPELHNKMHKMLHNSLKYFCLWLGKSLTILDIFIVKWISKDNLNVAIMHQIIWGEVGLQMSSKIWTTLLGNMTHFSFFMMQISPPSQRIIIPKYDAVSYSSTEKQNFFSAAVKNNFNMHVSCLMRTVLLLLHVH